MQAATFDAVEYFPTAQAVHVLAPVLVPVSVIDPAAHSAHESAVDAVEYLAGSHSMHELAPAPACVSVMEPA